MRCFVMFVTAVCVLFVTKYLIELSFVAAIIIMIIIIIIIIIIIVNKYL